MGVNSDSDCDNTRGSYVFHSRSLWDSESTFSVLLRIELLELGLDSSLGLFFPLLLTSVLLFSSISIRLILANSGHFYNKTGLVVQRALTMARRRFLLIFFITPDSLRSSRNLSSFIFMVALACLNYSIFIVSRNLFFYLSRALGTFFLDLLLLSPLLLRWSFEEFLLALAV